MPRLLRALLTTLALCAVALPAVLPGSGTRAYTVQTVEVSEAGFNPGLCKMNREFVRFKNVGSTTISVGRPSTFTGQPPFDVRVLAPGEYSDAYSIPYGGTTEFIDVDRPHHSMTVVTPVFVEWWDPSCAPAPGFQPPQPPCRTNPYCLRLPVLAVD